MSDTGKSYHSPIKEISECRVRRLPKRFKGPLETYRSTSGVTFVKGKRGVYVACELPLGDKHGAIRHRERDGKRDRIGQALPYALQEFGIITDEQRFADVKYQKEAEAHHEYVYNAWEAAYGLNKLGAPWPQELRDFAAKHFNDHLRIEEGAKQ